MLIHPRTLPLQIDNHSCGVFTCVNGYNCTLPNSFLIPSPLNIMHLRYWIAHIACSSEGRPLYKRKELNHNLNRSLINEGNRNLIMRDTVAGHGKMNGFFESLKQYVDTCTDIPQQSGSSCNEYDCPTNQTEEGIEANTGASFILTRETDLKPEPTIVENDNKVSTGNDEDLHDMIVDDDSLHLQMSDSSSDSLR